MGGDKVVIEPLDVENYGTWSLRMRALLIHKGLWKVVEGSSDTMTAVTDDSDKALALIMLNVKDHHDLTTLASCETAKEAWESLRKIYQSQLNARRMQLRKELTQLKKGPTEALTVYFARARSLWTDLTVAGHSMTESEIVLSVLSGLPSEYDTAVEILTTTTKEDFKMETVLGQLLQVEARHSRSETDGGGAQALYTRGNRWAGAQGSGNFKKPGGDSRPFKDNNKANADKKKGKCFFCGKLGHYEAECRTKLKAQQHRTAAHAALGDQAIVLTAASGNVNSYFWTVESGAQRHTTPKIQPLTDVHKLDKPVKVVFGNKTTAQAHYEGTAIFLTPIGHFMQEVQLANVLHVPECTVGNLFSVRQATQRGANVTFNSHGKCTMEVNGRRIIEAHGPGDNLYYIKAKPINDGAVIGATKVVESAQLWHRRFGHLGYDNLATLVKDEMVKGINVPAKDFSTAGEGVCEPCVKGKQPRNSFPTITNSKASTPLELIHMDICGPVTPQSQGKARYLATFLDDYSGLSVVKPLAHKWQVPQNVVDTLKFLETQCGRPGAKVPGTAGDQRSVCVCADAEGEGEERAEEHVRV